jgi:hypothetical protein
MIKAKRTIKTGDNASRKATKAASKKGFVTAKVADSKAGDDARPGAVPTGKIGQVFEMLKREEGVTVSQIMTAIGWQRPGAAHTLSSLRKLGHEIKSEKAKDGERTYRLAN